MITALIIAVHVFVCIALILIVLLQAGKGAEMGVSFGGGAAQSLLGSSGDTPMIGKITTAIAVIFMLTSLSLAYMSGHPKSKSVMDKKMPAKEQPVKENSKTETPVTQEASKTTTEKTEAPKTETAPATGQAESDKK